MKKTLVAAFAVATLFAAAGTLPAQAGENDLGLKASGNGPGPGGVYKGRAETTGAGQSVGAAAEADSRAAANPNSNNHDTGRVETRTDTTVKPPRTTAPGNLQ